MKPILFRSSFACLAFVGAASSAAAQSLDTQALRKNPAVQAAITTCQADAKKLCSGVIPGGGRIYRCLANQPDNVSPNCKAAIAIAQQSLVEAGIILAVPQEQ
jgi:hypothetical protein